MIRSFATVGGMTMLSRILGLVREVMIAATLGAGGAADAFYAAFRAPNLFRRIFAEGAFGMAFIPMFTKRLEDGEAVAVSFGNRALSMLASALFVFTLIATLAMPVLIYALAAGFSADPDKEALTILLARIMFPYLALVSLTALFSAVLNALGKFAVAAAAPIVLNIFMIGFAAGAMALGGDVAVWLAVGVALSGIAQLWLVWRAAIKAGIALRFQRPVIDADMRRLLTIAAPAAVAGGAMQVNLLIGSLIASFFDGAVAWLTYADRLYQLPLGVVGVAVGVVLMPELSRRARHKDMDGANISLNRASEFAMALTLPAAAGLMAMPQALASVLFERGAFTALDAAQTGQAAALFALGLPAYVLIKTLTPAFFAIEDTRTPLRFSLWSMGVGGVLSLAGAMTFGWLAIPVSTAIAAWLNVAMLALRLRAIGYRMDARFSSKLWRILLASALMGALVFAVVSMAQPVFVMAGWRYLALLGAVGFGFAAYAVIARALGAFTLAEIKAGMRR